MQLCQSGVEKGCAMGRFGARCSAGEKRACLYCQEERRLRLQPNTGTRPSSFAFVCCSVALDLVAVLIILGEVPHVAVECTNAAVLVQMGGSQSCQRASTLVQLSDEAREPSAREIY